MILAPAVVDRKGEQIELLLELRAKGFVRVRVVFAAYVNSAVNCPEQYLASGLYPRALQFKHQVQIALKLFGYPCNFCPYSLVCPASHIDHCRIMCRWVHT